MQTIPILLFNFHYLIVISQFQFHALIIFF